MDDALKALLYVFLAWALASTLDYHEARQSECAGQNLSYNSSEDTCE